MSAFFDQASLVVVPSGYKSGKIYAQKPLTTDGQLTFSRASTATRVNSAGLIEEVASNVPRLDYLGSTCPKLQLEPQRSNVVLQSSAFDNGAWTKFDTTVTANAGTSPDGTANADKIVPNTTNTRHILFQSATASTVHTFSVFAKAAGQNFLTMRLDDDTPEVNVFFNLSTGTIGATAGGSPTMTSYGNGWYRCSVTYTPSGTETIYAVLGSANVNGSIGYAGNGTDGILIYGAQLEAGTYATSYIPTTTAAVTRLAEATNLGTAISLTGDFTLFWEGTALQADLMLYGGGNLSWYAVILGVAGQVVLDTTTGRKVQGTFPSLVVGTKAKVAIRRQGGAHNIFVNGVKLTNEISVNDTATLSLSSMFWAYSSVYYKGQTVNQSLIFKTALTDSQAIELTTL